MADRLESIRSSFDRDADFERKEDAYRLTTTPFSLTVRVEPVSSDIVAYTVRSTVPSLDAAVADQTISETLLEGWAEPMERRLRDVHQATSLRDVDVSSTWDRDRFVTTFQFERSAQTPAPVDEVRAIAGYVEGTYLQGTIPGYSYRPPVDELLEKALERGEGVDPA